MRQDKLLLSALVLTIAVAAGCGGKQAPTPTLTPSPEPTVDVGATITARIQDAEAKRAAVYATMTAKAQDAQTRWNSIYTTATARARKAKPALAIEPTSTPQPRPASVKPPDTPKPAEAPTSGRVTVRVVQIIDGDTIEIEGGQRVRYIGVDTPERGSPFYTEATEANRQLVEGKTVELEKDVSETDRYGRLLRYVYVGNLMVNAELVRQGYAQVATFPPDVKYQDLFLQLQREARAAGRGLWAPLPTATPPPTEGGNVQITSIFYDGVVPRVESDEYALISNNGTAPVNLAGWHLNAGDPGQDFWFPDFIIQPGQSCRVYTNEHHPESCGFSFWSGRAIWNNKGDCGYLYDATGALVSEYCY